MRFSQVLVLLILFTSCKNDQYQNNIGNDKKFDTGFHLIGNHEFFLNEPIEKFQSRFEGVKFSDPEDLAIVRDLITYNGADLPIEVNALKYGSVITTLWGKILVSDSLAFSDFRNWKNWKKNNGWNEYTQGPFKIQYKFQQEAEGYMFKYSANYNLPSW